MGNLSLMAIQNQLNCVKQAHDCLNGSVKNVRIAMHQQAAMILRLEMDLKKAKRIQNQRTINTVSKQTSATIN